MVLRNEETWALLWRRCGLVCAAPTTGFSVPRNESGKKGQRWQSLTFS